MPRPSGSKIVGPTAAPSNASNASNPLKPHGRLPRPRPKPILNLGDGPIDSQNVHCQYEKGDEVSEPTLEETVRKSVSQGQEKISFTRPHQHKTHQYGNGNGNGKTQTVQTKLRTAPSVTTATQRPSRAPFPTPRPRSDRTPKSIPTPTSTLRPIAASKAIIPRTRNLNLPDQLDLAYHRGLLDSSLPVFQQWQHSAEDQLKVHCDDVQSRHDEIVEVEDLQQYMIDRLALVAWTTGLSDRQSAEKIDLLSKRVEYLTAILADEPSENDDPRSDYYEVDQDLQGSDNEELQQIQQVLNLDSDSKNSKKTKEKQSQNVDDIKTSRSHVHKGQYSRLIRAWESWYDLARMSLGIDVISPTLPTLPTEPMKPVEPVEPIEPNGRDCVNEKKIPSNIPPIHDIGDGWRAEAFILERDLTYCVRDLCACNTYNGVGVGDQDNISKTSTKKKTNANPNTKTNMETNTNIRSPMTSGRRGSQCHFRSDGTKYEPNRHPSALSRMIRKHQILAEGLLEELDLMQSIEVQMMTAWAQTGRT